MTVTFCCSDRGAGRSMTIANVGVALGLRGHRVVLVDADFERPALHGFFQRAGEPPEAQTRRGFRECILAYQSVVCDPIRTDDEQLQLPDLRDYLQPVLTQHTGSVWLLPAAQEDETKSVVRFDWEEFYRTWDGLAFLEWFRRELLQIADVVLIDSAPGMNAENMRMTEALADVCIMFGTIGKGVLRELAYWANWLKRSQLQEQRAGRFLTVIGVPAKIDQVAERSLLDGFSREFQRTFEPYARLLPGLGTQGMWEFCIPRVPYYEYAPSLVMLELGQFGAFEATLVAAYRRIAATIGGLLPLQSSDPTQLDGSDAPVQPSTAVASLSDKALLSRFAQLRERKTERPSVFISYAREDQERVLPIYEHLRNAGFRPWLDQKDLQGGQDWRDTIEKQIELSDFLIVCVSRRTSEKRGVVQQEIVWALDVATSVPEGNVYLIPVRLEPCEVPRRLQRFHWIDLFASDGGLSAVEQAIRSALRNRPNSA